jgi:putative ABC transport system permease protein
MRWQRVFRRTSWDEERARELDSYLEHEIADNMARGMTAAQARDAAHRKLGNETQIREEIYHMNSLGFIETLWQDVRYSVRGLRKSPGFTLVALLSLALGIGATTAIFSVVYGVLISPYPYARPGEIWAPAIRDLKGDDPGFSFHKIRDYRDIKTLAPFSEVMATMPETRLLTGERAPENFQAISVTANGFQFLGVQPILGRTIQPTDLRADGQPEPVIVLTLGAWSRLFDSSPDVLGKKLILNDQPFTVIGVMPSRFGWWTDSGGWVVLPEDPRDTRSAAVIMRLKPGVSSHAAEQQLHALHVRLAQEHPDSFPKAGFTTQLHNYLDITAASGTMQKSIQMLFGAVGFLLLIACANVANLQLARSTARGHEISVRMAVGARRGRLVRQLLTESVVLSVAGGIAGVALAIAITKGVMLMVPPGYLPNEARVTVNIYVLLFSAAIAILTGVLFGLAPALKSSRPDLVDALKDAGRSNSSASGGRTRAALVVVEIALSVVLLMGASLTIRGFLQLQAVDPGFQADRVLLFGVNLPSKHYVTYTQRVAFAENLVEALRTIPGAQSVAIGNGGLPYAGQQSTFTIEGQPKDESRHLAINLVSSGYAQTLGIPMRSGRDLTPQEIAHAEPFALINVAARKLWPAGVDPIGAHVHLDQMDKLPPNLLAPPNVSPVVTVVGIMADTRNDGLNNPTAPSIYLPYTVIAPTGRTLAIRTTTPPMSILNAVRERIRTVDRDLPLGRPLTLAELFGRETDLPKFNMALFSFFGLLGLAIAAIGIYSTLSYTVARRTHEIGIRMALGAARADVLGLMVRMAGRLVAIGLAIGLVASLTLARLLRSEIFQVPSTDPLALGGVVLLLTLTAFLACVVPSRRATKLDPMSALRHE